MGRPATVPDTGAVTGLPTGSGGAAAKPPAPGCTRIRHPRIGFWRRLLDASRAPWTFVEYGPDRADQWPMRSAPEMHRARARIAGRGMMLFQGLALAAVTAVAVLTVN